jgi:HEAT repeat protein
MKRLFVLSMALVLSGCGKSEPEYMAQPLSFWITALESPDLHLQSQASNLLVEIATKDPRVIPALCQSVKNGSTAAAEVLGRIGPVGDRTNEVVTVLVESVKDKKHITSARLASAKALPRLGPPAKAALPTLLAMLKDDDPNMRAQAAETLGRIPGVRKEVTAPLQEATKDHVLVVRNTAKEALEKLEAEDAPEPKKP